MQTEYVLRDIAPPRLRAPVQDSSDEALIGLIAEGDKRAMQVLYARHNVRVYRFILRMTANNKSLPLNVYACGVNNAQNRRGNFRTDTVAGNQRHVVCHLWSFISRN